MSRACCACWRARGVLAGGPARARQALVGAGLLGPGGRGPAGAGRRSAGSILACLEPFFAAKTANPPGYVCTDAKAQNDIKAYGFLVANGFPRRGPAGWPRARTAARHTTELPRRGPRRGVLPARAFPERIVRCW